MQQDVVWTNLNNTLKKDDNDLTKSVLINEADLYCKEI